MNYSMMELVWLLLIYSFLGWVVETIVGTVKKKTFVNRGFSTGPFCLVYGIAAVFMAVTMEELMAEHPEKVDEYMEQFVDLQLEIHSKTAPLLGKLKDKLARQINSLKDVVDATTRYELLTRLDSMPKHHKVCHGDYNPSNVIVGEDGSLHIVDWAHATQATPVRTLR